MADLLGPRVVGIRGLRPVLAGRTVLSRGLSAASLTSYARAARFPLLGGLDSPGLAELLLERLLGAGEGVGEVVLSESE